jgi:hypothetical protein
LPIRSWGNKCWNRLNQYTDHIWRSCRTFDNNLYDFGFEKTPLRRKEARVVESLSRWIELRLRSVQKNKTNGIAGP